ncbi:chorismate mutase [Lyophyllum atratum]|nr:chorismate mutase [Lyophyllum atratum]
MMPTLRVFTSFCCSAGLAIAVRVPSSHNGRPALVVPTLPEVRAILAQLQGPIVSTLIARAALPAEPSLYSDGGRFLTSFIHKKEVVAQATGRYTYGTLEYPFTLPLVSPDTITSINSFPGGVFHQDTYTPNPGLLSFYLRTLVALLGDANAAVEGTSIFFHLTQPAGPADRDTKFTLDAQLLASLSHRASIGKVVAEAKFNANITAYTPLIQSRDRGSLRVLLTNTTQEQVVLDGAANASLELATAWETAQAASPTISTNFITRVQIAVAEVYRELIDMTTDVEMEYLLQRLD